jgi:hypothetical protein
LQKTIASGNAFGQQSSFSTNITSHRGQQKKTVDSFVITLDKILIILRAGTICDFINCFYPLIPVKG